MKNTKLIALVAVLVVVSLVVSIAVALGNDKKGFGEIDTTIKNYEQQIAELNKTIEELNKGLISSTEALEKLQAAGVEIKNWNEATAVLAEKLVEVEDAYLAFVESVKVYDEKDEKKENPLVTFADLYNFTYTVGEDEVNHAAQFATLKADAVRDLGRATSVAEMNTIIANYKTALTNVPTVLDLYIANLEAVEKDGKVTYDEYETIEAALMYANLIKNDNIYAPKAEGEEKGQKELLKERYDALMAEYKPLVVEKFVELVKALPEVELLAPSHYEAVEAARKEAAKVITLYGATEAEKLEKNKKGKLTAYGTALETLAEVEARELVVKTIEQHAKDLNEFLAKAFDEETLKAAGVKYGANIETYNHLAYVGDQIDNWIEKREIVTDEKDEEYNAELYNLVNHNVYEGYVANFEAEVATLRAAADEFIAAVEAIENVNLDSKATLDAAKVLFDKVSKGQMIADLDEILELDDILDEDGELVEEVTNVSEAYDAWLNQYARYNWLVGVKERLEKAVKATEVKCAFDHGTDKEGNKLPCDGKDQCADVGTLDYELFDMTLVAEFDHAIKVILVEYELDETVFDAELLAVYKMARLQTILAEVKQNLADAYAASTLSADKAKTLNGVITEEIEAIAAEYTFAVKLVCVDPTNKDHECDCAEDLANWVWAIENEPATALAEKYTPAILANRFSK